MNKGAKQKLADAFEALAKVYDEIDPHMEAYAEEGGPTYAEELRTAAEWCLSDRDYRLRYMCDVADMRQSLIESAEDAAPDPDWFPNGIQHLWRKAAQAMDSLIIALIEADRT